MPRKYWRGERARPTVASRAVEDALASFGVVVREVPVRTGRQPSVTVLIATHEHHIAARCDRLVRLRDGRAVEDVDLTGGHGAQSTLDRISGLRL